jgi:hypothetical protein
MEYIASIALRKGTGDEWPSIGMDLENNERDIFNYCIQNFKREMKIIYNFSLESTGIINPGGYYKFLKFSEVEKLYGHTKWFQDQNDYISKCPWIGKILAYFCWTPNECNYFELLKAVVKISRGIVASIQNQNKFFFCLKEENIVLNKFINDSIPLLVELTTKMKVTYLNKIYEQFIQIIEKAKKNMEIFLFS